VSVLLVVPARGGSIGIPRKATRLLGDKPVILWTLETIRGLGAVLVATDDDEIAGLATQSGAAVFRETPYEGQRALDGVIWQAIQGLPGDVIGTIQCTSPFLSRHTVEACLEFVLTGQFDTALTVRDDRGLRWERSKLETTKSQMPARLTRQQMPPTWRETGGALITRREHVSSHTRIGPRVRLVPVRNEEALDLDEEADWMLGLAYLEASRSGEARYGKVW
jgi:CMP-N-acetylneuraminic acid synthetase